MTKSSMVVELLTFGNRSTCVNGYRSVVAIVGFLVSQQAIAQTSTVVPPEESDGDIVVTARHRDESVMKIPLSVSAFTSAQLEAQGILSFKDLSHSIPGLQYYDRGNLQTEVTIRGVGGDSRNPGIDAGVGMYIDGVYIARTSGYNADLSDIERVEVLRGPQGTLFGKNTIGGVINITSKKPTDETAAHLYTSYGNYNAIRAQGSVSGPITSNLFGGITVAAWDRDGYIRNIYDGTNYNSIDRRGAKAQLRWLLGDAIEINANADVTRDRGRAVLTQPSSGAGAAAPYYTGSRFVISNDQRNEDTRDMWGASLSADYSFSSGAVLSSISAYRDIDLLVYSDVDGLPIDNIHSGPFTDRSQMASQELRIVSPGDQSFRYVGGLYYFHQKIIGDRDIYFGGALGAQLFSEATTDSYAGYVNADYDILPDLTATGGIRYTYERKNGAIRQIRTGFNYNFPNLRRSDENVSWTGSLRYTFSPLVSAYATVSRGFKSGGFNLDVIGATGLAANDLQFAPERVTNYEIGIKARTDDNRLRATLSVFSMDYSDKQVSQFIQTSGTDIPSNQVTNAGQARIKGFEFEATAKLVRGLTLSGTLAHLDARYVRFDSAAQIGGLIVSYTGNRIERTPDWTATGSIEYRYDLGAAELVASGSTSYRGDVYLQPNGSTRTFQKSYALVDARFGVNMENGLSVFLWGKNVTQKGYITFARVFSGLDQAVYGEPRTYGVEARYRF